MVQTLISAGTPPHTHDAPLPLWFCWWGKDWVFPAGNWMEGTAGTKYTLWEGQKRRQRICQLTVQNRGSPPGGWATLENESHGKKSKESEHPVDVPPRDSFAVRKVLRCSFTHRVIITEGPIEGTVLRQEEMIASERSNFLLVKLPARPTFSIPTKDTKEHSK